MSCSISVVQVAIHNCAKNMKKDLSLKGKEKQNKGRNCVAGIHHTIYPSPLSKAFGIISHLPITPGKDKSIASTRGILIYNTSQAAMYVTGNGNRQRTHRILSCCVEKDMQVHLTWPPDVCQGAAQSVSRAQPRASEGSQLRPQNPRSWNEFCNRITHCNLL